MGEPPPPPPPPELLQGVICTYQWPAAVPCWETKLYNSDQVKIPAFKETGTRFSALVVKSSVTSVPIEPYKCSTIVEQFSHSSVSPLATPFFRGEGVLNLTIGLVKLRHRLFKQLGEEHREMPLGW